MAGVGRNDGREWPEMMQLIAGCSRTAASVLGLNAVDSRMQPENGRNDPRMGRVCVGGL